MAEHAWNSDRANHEHTHCCGHQLEVYSEKGEKHDTFFFTVDGGQPQPGGKTADETKKLAEKAAGYVEPEPEHKAKASSHAAHDDDDGASHKKSHH